MPVPLSLQLENFSMVVGDGEETVDEPVQARDTPKTNSIKFLPLLFLFKRKSENAGHIRNVWRWRWWFSSKVCAPMEAHTE